MFGKLMSIPDSLMVSYCQLLTDRSTEAIATLRREIESGSIHPMDSKMDLAKEIIAGFHGHEAAQKAADEFQRVFRERRAPEEAPLRRIPRGPGKKLPVLLLELQMVPSRAEAERLIKQGGVEIDGVREDDVRKELDLSAPREFLLRAGKKKFVRVLVE